MTKTFEPLVPPYRRSRSLWLALMTGVVLGVTAVSGTAQAQAPAAATGAASSLPAEDLTNLVGPIALYPDDLIAIILPASTNPLQIVQADRFLEKRKTEPKAPLDDKWDDAVKSLLNYPDIVKMMSADLDWTSALGEEVVADQGAVLDAVQSFRRKAQAAGNLKSDGKQVVAAEQEIITITPANPEVIYVPQYNPTTVVTYGVAPVYGYYPTAYPSYYYPYAPGAALAAGVIWGAAIGAAWSGNRYGYGGGNNTINVNRNTNVNRSNASSVNRGGGAGQGGGSAWKSDKKPGQVSSSVGKSGNASRPGDARGGSSGGRAGGGSSVGGGGGFGGAGAGAGAGARPSTQPAGGGGATRSGGGGGNAFGDSGASGRQTQMDSSRGASSRSSASGGGARPSPSYSGGGGGSGARSSGGGGGARSSGGGGGARGGGGGGRGGGGRR